MNKDEAENIMSIKLNQTFLKFAANSIILQALQYGVQTLGETERISVRPNEICNIVIGPPQGEVHTLNYLWQN